MSYLITELARMARILKHSAPQDVDFDEVRSLLYQAQVRIEALEALAAYTELTASRAGDDDIVTLTATSDREQTPELLRVLLGLDD